MSNPPVVPTMRPEPDRDGYGRYLIPNRDKPGHRRAYSRATTIAHTLSDEFLLTQWKRRMVAQGLVVEPALLDRVQIAATELEAAGEDWRAAKEAKRALNELCDEAAAAAGAERGSHLGTALHALTEWSDAGRLDEVEVPEGLAADLAAYQATMAEAGISRPAEYIERVVVNYGVDAAGTLDRLLLMPDGRLVVGDLKTQKSIDFGWLEIAIQLAEYAYADAMLADVPGLGPELVAMPEVDRSTAIVMWLPVGQARCTLHEIDISAGWHAAQIATEVRRLRSLSKDMGRPYQPARWAPRSTCITMAGPGGSPAVSNQLLYLIRTAPHLDSLTALWRDPSMTWSEAHIEAARIRKTELLDVANLQ